MKIVLYAFLLLSALGLTLGVAAHAMALAGVPLPGGK
jgi:hypothetical protein